MRVPIEKPTHSYMLRWSLIPKLLLASLYTSPVERAVIPAWMPETGHRDVNIWFGIEPKSCPRGIGRLPSLALDSGIHAGMTCLS